METTTTHLPGGTPEPELEEVGDPKTIRVNYNIAVIHMPSYVLTFASLNIIYRMSWKSYWMDTSSLSALSRFIGPTQTLQILAFSFQTSVQLVSL